MFKGRSATAKTYPHWRFTLGKVPHYRNTNHEPTLINRPSYLGTSVALHNNA